ncbi:MAG: hypothetical protein ACRD3Y_09920, partial [Bryobacteraceae bacterium]
MNVLLKFARLYGLEHARSAAQFDTSWSELQEAVHAAGSSGLLMGTSGSQLLLDGVPLESTQAERSFAELLNAAGVASIGFLPSVERDQFANLVNVFADSGPKASSLSERLEQHFGKGQPSGIVVNEIRFVAEDAAFSETRMAAQLAVKTLGADAERVQDWFRSPEKMIQLIAAAEGAHGGGSGTGGGPDSGSGTAPSGSARGSHGEAAGEAPVANFYSGASGGTGSEGGGTLLAGDTGLPGASASSGPGAGGAFTASAAQG